MGVNNRQRRAAKAKQRARQHRAGRTHGSNNARHADEPAFTPGERVRGLLRTAVSAAVEGDNARFDHVAGELAGADRAIVLREGEGELLATVGLLWRNGWQPAEVIRQARRGDSRSGRLVASAVAADHARRDPATLHPRWAAQVAGLELPETPVSGWLGDLAAREWWWPRQVVAAVVTALAALRVAPLNELIPPPGATPADPLRAAADVDDPVLTRVRALLAQAESTTFAAEAEVFTAKAQELMARHAIDTALLWADSARDERPTTIRLAIDDPYADVKSLLLQYVATHSRCRAVFNPTYALSSVVGFASDVAAAEMLFTSLLVQSQAALQAEAANAGPGSRARSRAFRSSFLLAFTHRIDQRLAAINAAVEQAAAAEASSALLPVLAARDDVVDGVVAEQFGTLTSSPVRGGSDAAGWVRGTLAADLAKLNAGDLADTADAPGSGRRPMLS